MAEDNQDHTVGAMTTEDFSQPVLPTLEEEQARQEAERKRQQALQDAHDTQSEGDTRPQAAGPQMMDAVTGQPINLSPQQMDAVTGRPIEQTQPTPTSEAFRRQR